VAALAALLVWYELIAPGIKVGQRYHLTNHNVLYAGPGATVFPGKDDLEATERAKAAQADWGLYLRGGVNGNAFLLPAGTEVLVLGYGDVDYGGDKSLHVYNVRILGGEFYAGKTGWVEDGAIVP
jgi:hypothetical protein